MNEQYLKLLKKMIRTKRIEYLLLAELMPYGLKIWQNQLDYYAMNEVFEKEDGVSIIYVCYKEVVKEFIKYKLDPCLFIAKFGLKIKTSTLNFIRSHKKTSDYVLNNIYYYNEDRNLVYDVIEYDYQFEHYLNMIYDCLQSNLHKKIVKMKIDGYSNSEISRRLRLSPKAIENNIFYIRRKLEKSNVKNIFLMFMES